ncbi:MAG: hypothetical protein ACYST5_02600 [Planctomycetota bacterium]|jgi:hypothetical protein
MVIINRDCQLQDGYEPMRSLNRKTVIELLTQNLKDCRSGVEYFGSQFGSGNHQTGNDQIAGVTRSQAPAGLPPWGRPSNLCAASLVAICLCV